MAALNIANDSHKEYLSNKLKNQNCFATNYNIQSDAIPQGSNNKKNNQEMYKSYLDAQVDINY